MIDTKQKQNDINENPCLSIGKAQRMEQMARLYGRCMTYSSVHQLGRRVTSLYIDDTPWDPWLQPVYVFYDSYSQWSRWMGRVLDGGSTELNRGV